MTKIEHFNITVPNIDEAIKFIKIVAPDFEVRRDDNQPDSHRWVHIGNDEYYIALQEPHLDSEPKQQFPAYKNYRVNHVALVVTDLQTIEKNLLASGYSKGIGTPNEKFRNRAYYYDKSGFEWELVEYMSSDPKEKFLYE